MWIESGTCFGKLHQNCQAGSVTLGHWTLVLADDTLVKRAADPCPQKGQGLVIVCLGDLVRMRAICFEQSHRLTAVDGNTKRELDECLFFFRADGDLLRLFAV